MIISRVVSLIIQKNTFVKIKFMRYICELRQYFPRKRSFFRFSFFFFLGGRLPPARQLARLCLGAKMCIVFLLLQFWKELWRFKVKESMFLLKKTKQNRKWKIPRRFFERWTLCVSSYKNRKFKVKLWWVGARKRKKECIFCNVFLLEENFF